MVCILLEYCNHRTSLRSNSGRSVNHWQCIELMVIDARYVHCCLMLEANVGIVPEDSSVGSPVYQRTADRSLSTEYLKPDGICAWIVLY